MSVASAMGVCVWLEGLLVQAAVANLVRRNPVLYAPSNSPSVVDVTLDGSRRLDLMLGGLSDWETRVRCDLVCVGVGADLEVFALLDRVVACLQAAPLPDDVQQIELVPEGDQMIFETDECLQQTCRLSLPLVVQHRTTGI